MPFSHHVSSGVFDLRVGDDIDWKEEKAVTGIGKKDLKI